VDENLEYATNLKWILYCFYQLSRMRFNFHKNDLLTINLDRHVYVQIFFSKESNFPMTWVLLPYSNLRGKLQPLS
jgi:hypothetical protein